MRQSNTRKKAIRWAKASIAAQKKRLKKQAKRDAAYHKSINSKPGIY